MGIEPTSEAWEASILPLYDARSASLAKRLYATSEGPYSLAIFLIFPCCWRSRERQRTIRGAERLSDPRSWPGAPARIRRQPLPYREQSRR
jgi:hypothetical protein